MKRLIELILIISFACFGIASAITTFLGVLSVLESYNDYLKYALSSLIAFATSGVMLYIGFNIPNFKQEGKLILAVLAYFVIASMSIFFNFVTFYQGQIVSRTIEEDVRVLNSELTKSYGDSKLALENSLNVSALKDSVQIYENLVKSEKYHPNRPGPGMRWDSLKKKLDTYRGKLASATETYNQRMKEINLKSEDANKALEEIARSENADEKMIYAEQAVKKIDEINALTKTIRLIFLLG
ncbi:MAG: hypothetical protein HUU34_22425 [Saprospiraceae bacterium]|nr:hypothetical protein [Saprospiraceae bacterium]